MSNHTLSTQVASTQASDWEEKYNNLLKEYTMLKENMVFTVEEARQDRDFYMALYEGLLSGQEVAA